METGMKPRMIAWLAVCAALAVVRISPVIAQEKDKTPQVLEGTTVTAPRPGMAAPTLEPVAPPANPTLDPLTTSGRSLPVENTIGSPYSASEGVITQADIANRPLLRPGEVLELIPGLIVTQHTGILKANQYFLRGFSLDHGTDFAGFIDDIPWNLPTHAHGQGYLDLNCLIPELIGTIDFGKGPYYASVGDFSSVGYAKFYYLDDLPYGIFKTEVGKNAWLRGLVADSGHVGGGTLLYGVEGVYYNAPFDVKEHANKVNAIFRWTLGNADDGLRLNAYIYQGQTGATTQIPQRAVYEGIIDSLGSIDPTDYLVTSRYTLNLQWWHHGDRDKDITQGNLYGYYYDFSLFNNFTFFLQDPEHGDQINQIDRRWVTGYNLSQQWAPFFVNLDMVNKIGVQLQNSWMPHVGLHHTQARMLLNDVTDDNVDEFSAGIYWTNQVKWSAKVRTVFGLRGDYYYFNVDDHDMPINSGNSEAKRINPKASLVLGPWARTEFFLNGGYSYHSNDARSVLLQSQPTNIADLTPQPATPAAALVPSRGAEVGFRSQAIPGLTAGAALWYLRLGQELVFSGDSGTTTPLRASERYGIELTNTYQLNGWLSFNADYAATRGRLLGIDPEVPGNHIPEGIGTTFSAGPSINLPNGLFAILRFRYLGPRYLIEDASASSRATQLFELSTGYQSQRLSVGLELLNLFNSNGHDIDYFYASALPSDPGFGTPGFQGVNDIHFRRLEPLAARFFLMLKF
jgi:hypothetical protein